MLTALLALSAVLGADAPPVDPYLQQSAATFGFRAGRPAAVTFAPDGKVAWFLRSGPRSRVSSPGRARRSSPDISATQPAAPRLQQIASGTVVRMRVPWSTSPPSFRTRMASFHGAFNRKASNERDCA